MHRLVRFSASVASGVTRISPSVRPSWLSAVLDAPQRLFDRRALASVASTPATLVPPASLSSAPADTVVVVKKKKKSRRQRAVARPVYLNMYPRGKEPSRRRIPKVEQLSLPHWSKSFKYTTEPDGRAFVEGPLGRVEINMSGLTPVGNGVLWTHDLKRVRLLQSSMRNAVHGVCFGHYKSILMKGIGLKCWRDGHLLIFDVGKTHYIAIKIPHGVSVVRRRVQLIMHGIDKQKVTHFAARVRALCPPDKYKDKGFRYIDEEIKLRKWRK